MAALNKPPGEQTTKHRYRTNVRSYEKNGIKDNGSISGMGNEGPVRRLGDGAGVGFEIKNSTFFKLGLILLLNI